MADEATGRLTLLTLADQAVRTVTDPIPGVIRTQAAIPEEGAAASEEATQAVAAAVSLVVGEAAAASLVVSPAHPVAATLVGVAAAEVVAATLVGAPDLRTTSLYPRDSPS